MTHVFVDTSAFLSILDADDPNHAVASRHWDQLLGDGTALITTNYVVVETCAVVQRRFGLQAVRKFIDEIAPLLDVHWVDAGRHEAGVAALLAANRRLLSLVDCVSFVVVRQRGVDAVFAYDEHFADQGFRIL
jgi:predicted nucleic acid-binding protein